MPTKYSAKKKYEVLRYSESNGIKNTVIKYEISRTTIYRWKQKFDGNIKSLENNLSRKNISHPKEHTTEEIENIKEILRDNPYITNKGLYEELKRNYGYNRSFGGLYNFLRKNKIVLTVKVKKDYATMFDSEAVKILNGNFLFTNKNILPLYIIELNNNGIYIAREEKNNSCKLTVYYSASLRFNKKEEAENFIKSIKNNSTYKLNIKELKYSKKT